MRETNLPPYPPFTDKIVSLPEAAHLAGVSPDTLRRCHKRQELKLIKIIRAVACGCLISRRLSTPGPHIRATIPGCWRQKIKAARACRPHDGN